MVSLGFLVYGITTYMSHVIPIYHVRSVMPNMANIFHLDISHVIGVI